MVEEEGDEEEERGRGRGRDIEVGEHVTNNLHWWGTNALCSQSFTGSPARQPS